MTTGKSQSADVIIAGAGIAGLALACILAGHGVRVSVLDPAPPAPISETPTSGRTIALMRSSLHVIAAAGLSNFAGDYGTPLRRMRLVDESLPAQKRITSEFEAGDIGLPYFGMNIPNSLLRSALFEKFCALKTAHFMPATIENAAQDSAVIRVQTGTGDEITGLLLIGADGRASRVRDLAGIAVTKRDYAQTALTCIINHSQAHCDTSTEFHRPGGPFALVPMAGNQSAVVWVEPKDKAESLLRLKRGEFESALQHQTSGILGAITLETTPEGWPLCSIKAQRLIAPRMALIAEAAHVMSPITAQGLNLSLRDAATLAEVIIDGLRLGIDAGSPSLLQRYARRRAADITTRVWGVDIMNRLVSTEITALMDLRRAGLKMVDRVAPLKSMAMHHGLAPSLDQDRILKGLAV